MIHDGFFLAGNAPALELIGRGLVRPGTVYALGRNYAEHAAEMGGEVPPEPMIFLKPSTSVIGPGDAVRLPHQSQQVEHEAFLTLLARQAVLPLLLREALKEIRGVAGNQANPLADKAVIIGIVNDALKSKQEA